ncbi:S-adenosyl-L-methionine-dependent methyltransferase [Ascobolus immersus RN42]|uniref:S-adenosyl-L-methionine-dependent methyltransferase n=1 Tax=Ascobolus immersus RN42 TaxID=1160509 RepID=A0A3N4HLC6_ASCIM|nr:S-adenosyl-L-methionine-dependent methyltransferase [Ascobolus immersus RN42]
MAAVESSPYEERIEIGDDVSESEYESSLTSETTSLTSSVFNFVYENGRRYTSDRKGAGSGYVLPNDEQEQERLDLVHHAWTLGLKGELHVAPLPKAESDEKFTILDLGTGTGIWAIDMGDLYPNSEVLGIDCSPIQPTWLPPNVRFEVDDFEEEWVYRRTFDFIHGRNLVGTVQDWPRLLQQAYKHLAPGGVLELDETHVTGCHSEDDTCPPGGPVDRYNKALAEAGLKMGRDATVAPRLKQMLEDAGFVDVVEKRIRWPVGMWPKDQHQKQLGAVALEVCNSGVEAYGLAALTRVLGWELGKAKELINEVVQTLGKRGVHAVYPQFIVYGRKPEEKPVEASA